MQLQKILKRISWVLPFAVSFAVADAIPVDALSAGGAQTRDQQLREIRDILLGGRGGFVDIGFNYLPLPTQVTLESPYGEHDGYAFKQHVAFFGSSKFDKNLHVGGLLWLERSGWDSEDFILFPHYGKFSHVGSVATWGLSFTQTAMDVTFAAGMQHRNLEYVSDVYPEESDSLAYSWAHLRWSGISMQGNFYRNELRSLRLSLDLESRQVYGGSSSGIKTFLPNVEATYYKRQIDGSNEDFVRVNWEQNLYGQVLYAEASYDFPDDGFHSAALKFYPDASRMVAFEASCLRRVSADDKDDLLWGGAIEFPFIRIGYNSSYDYDNFFHAKGTVIVELQFNLGTIDGFMFARRGAKSAPLETLKLDGKNKMPNESSFKEERKLENKHQEKILEAKGIRYEKVNNGGNE